VKDGNPAEAQELPGFAG